MGHMDIIVRAASIFEEVHVVIALNRQKEPLFSLEDRSRMLRQLVDDRALSNVVIGNWKGLIVDYARRNACSVLIRSIRTAQDTAYEQTMASMNARLDGRVETFLIFARPEYADISSSAVRELVSWGRLPVGIVPELVQKELEKRFGPLLQV